MTPALPDTATGKRLAELRREWLQYPDRRPQIEDQAAQITAVHLLRTMLGAEIIQGDDQ